MEFPSAKKTRGMKRHLTIFLFLLILTKSGFAQTDTDGLMMAKRNLCGGFLYRHTSWNQYWEGTYLGKNDNIGTFSSHSVMAMANYGITDRFNVIAMAPWISNKVSAGTLIGQSGFQDLSLMLKYRLLSQTILGLDVSAIGILGGSMPLSNYVADYLPLSIGLHSRNAQGRLILDVQRGHWYATASSQYIIRGNSKIDRTAYYTTEMIYSNQVALPDVTTFNLRAGWRKDTELIIELVYDQMNTLGGFDMRKNEMPFLSNTMNTSRLGINCKLPIPGTNGLSFMGSAMTTLAGRNMGKANMFTAGFVYQAMFHTKESK
jgi:hypothetical protein